ncbi:MAG: exodeoxyribonuclease VII small subunit [Thermoguttaceae bacterium]|nr:exodeoxyribonuclease VII small subunit [Thermoguttaceae bacterium]
MDASKKTPKEDSPTFEEAYRQLQTIVTSLDSGQGGLEESLASFEEGMRLLKLCRDKLDGASRRIELLKGRNEQGEPILAELDEEGLSSQTDVAGRQTPLKTRSVANNSKRPEPSKQESLFLLDGEQIESGEDNP